MAIDADVLIVGAGLFGVTAARELRARGSSVMIIDGGPLPRPLAASFDISKVVRIEYGRDLEYMILAEQAREGWLRWNTGLFAEPLYHEVGILRLTRSPMAPGSHEYDNFQALAERGHQPERLTQSDIAERFPAWNSHLYVDGYLNPKGGYVEAGLVVEELVRHAALEGVAFRTGYTVTAIHERPGHIHRVDTQEHETFSARDVLVTAGAWTPLLVPELRTALRPTGQPVFHLRPLDPSLFAAARFPVFSADRTHNGWYGFPLHPRAGVVKIANHVPGWPVDPVNDARTIPERYVERLRHFVAETFPTLADAPISHMRCCLYCDTPDEHFWIARHPTRRGLTIASGDSGHAFKFGPLLGGWIADAVEGRPNATLRRFSWRTATQETVGMEGSRYRGDA